MLPRSYVIAVKRSVWSVGFLESTSQLPIVLNKQIIPRICSSGFPAQDANPPRPAACQKVCQPEVTPIRRRVFLQSRTSKLVMSDVRQFVHRPGGALRRYVREILWVNSEHSRVQVLLPETTLTLVLRQSGAASLHNEKLPHTIVSGLQKRTRMVEHAPGSSLIIVRFTEVGAPAILHGRVDLLYNQTVPLDNLLPWQEIDRIQNILAGTREIRQQILPLERFLTSQIRAENAISPQIEAAAEMIRNSQGRASITAIARHVAMSQSALERHFCAAVGATPKKLSRLARLQHVCRLWDSGQTLTEIAFEAGYCDQPHMVRDFRLFTGTSPGEFFQSTHPRNLPTFYK
jgi:AraC-like DNA-binding protein